MKRFLKPLLLLLATCLLLLLIGELLASFTREGNASMYVADPVLSIVRKPDTDGYVWGKDRWIPVHINKLGLRGEDVPLPKPPDERWVLCLGDSFTFGGGVQTDEAWPQQLQAQLGPPDNLVRAKAAMDDTVIKPEEKLLPVRRKRYGDGPVPMDFWVATDTPIWKQVRRELATMKRLCDEHGATFVVAMLPDPTWSGPGTFPCVDRLAALLDDLDVPWVDVQTDFLDRGPAGTAVGRRNDLWQPYDPVHSTAEANGS